MASLAALAVLAVLIVSGWSCAGAGTGLVVGRVEGFDGGPEDYRVLREGRLISVDLFLELFDGDEVSVLHDSHRIRLDLYYGDGRLVEWGKRQGPLVVRAGAVPTVGMNFRRWAWSWFAKAREENSVSVHVRGATGVVPLSLPLLAERPGRLIAGTRPLAIAWFGGRPPYRVCVYRVDTQSSILALEEIGDLRLRSDSIALRPGAYVVEVRDADGSRVSGRFEVLPKGQAPPDPAELSQSRLPDPVRTTMVAVWLASRGNGAWVLEAYQRVVPLAASYYPASLLRDTLEQGERPAAPPE